MLPTKQPKYKDGRVKQSFKDETDINKILKRAQKTGTISHMNKYEGSYGDFANFDFFEAQIMLTKGREIFDALPSEIRNEFGQSQGAFFNYVNDPVNKDRLTELLPGLAAPGRQNIETSGVIPADVVEDDPPKDPIAEPGVVIEKPLGGSSEPAKTPPGEPGGESSGST